MTYIFPSTYKPTTSVKTALTEFTQSLKDIDQALKQEIEKSRHTGGQPHLLEKIRATFTNQQKQRGA